MRIDIISTQIKNNEFVHYVWTTVLNVVFEGDRLRIVLESGYIVEYNRQEFVTFSVTKGGQ